MSIEDSRTLATTFFDSWAILCDKVYQGATEFLLVVHPHRKLSPHTLTTERENFNFCLSSERALVENYYEQMSSLWTIVSFKYRWNHDTYNVSIKLGAGLINIHVLWHPLKKYHRDKYVGYPNRLFAIGTESTAKRNAAQRKYQAKFWRKPNTQRYVAFDTECKSASESYH